MVGGGTVAGKPWKTGATGDTVLRALAALVSKAQQLQGLAIAGMTQASVVTVPHMSWACTVGVATPQCYAC